MDEQLAVRLGSVHLALAVFGQFGVKRLERFGLP